MDSILSYHMNPLTCGVARFNQALANKLNIKCLQLFSDASSSVRRPLLSIKLSEFRAEDAEKLESFADQTDIWPELSLFFHDFSDTKAEMKLLQRATTVYCGNDALFRKLQNLHHDVVLAWCPGYLFDARPFNDDAEVSVYTFGMAHKLQTDHYFHLRDLLEASNKSYAVYISAAIHEGRSLDDTFTGAYDRLVECFGERIHFLGFVSDSALFNYLQKTTFFAAFFEEGVRANNTSVNTAMHCGAAVITNLDKHSPDDLVHMDNLIDIRQCKTELPLDTSMIDSIRESGKQYAATHGWRPLIDLFERKIAVNK